MLNIQFVREHSEIVRASLKKRNDAEKLAWLEELLKIDAQWRKLRGDTDALRARRNSISKDVSEAKRKGKDTSALMKEAKRLPDQIKQNEAAAAQLEEKIRDFLMRLPNILHDSVPVGKDETENVVVKSRGKPVVPDFEVKHHGQLAAELGIADFERAVKVAGTGFFYLKGPLALLDLALQRYAIDKLAKKGYTFVAPPYLLKREAYEGVVSLEDFETVMYKVDGQDSYLIATAEHPIGAMFKDEILSEEQLPLKLVGFSPCFRREIGKHGLDERGFFRVHQFNKVEQFIFCKPEDSWKHFEELARNCQELLEELEIPYTVTNICTGDIGIIAAKKFDTNGWSPREKKYIELMSCSNCTDYQANRLNIKFKRKGAKQGEKEALHTLNNTMIATTRALRIIIENYQTKDGTIKVPKVLQPYMDGLKEITKQKSF